MPWFKVDDQLYSHPKWLAIPAGARALWVTAGSWCAAQLTDGHVPRHVLPILGGRPRDASELVKAGLWREVDGGWEFHGWLELQPAAEEVRTKREELSAARSAAGRKGAAARWQKDGKAMATTPQAEPQQADGKAMAPTRPDLVTTPQPPAERGATDATHDGQHPNCRRCGTSRRSGTPPAPLASPASRLPRAADLVPPPLTDEERAAADQAKAAALASVPFLRPRPTRESA